MTYFHNCPCVHTLSQCEPAFKSGKPIFDVLTWFASRFLSGSSMELRRTCEIASFNSTCTAVAPMQWPTRLPDALNSDNVFLLSYRMLLVRNGDCSGVVEWQAAKLHFSESSLSSCSTSGGCAGCKHAMQDTSSAILYSRRVRNI